MRRLGQLENSCAFLQEDLARLSEEMFRLEKERDAMKVPSLGGASQRRRWDAFWALEKS